MLSVPRRATVFAGLTSVVAIATLQSQPVVAQSQSQFSDINSSWARPFIETLAQKNIISGFPDGTFRPDQSVTRAEFAAIVQKAFTQTATQPSRSFQDVSSGFWAAPAVDYASSTGFLSGYTNGTFQPSQGIPKVQALVAIASGLNLQPEGSVDSALLRYYDASQIPNYARPGIAAATQRNIPVNYPDVGGLNPNQTATRADISAFIHQALVSQGKLAPIGTDFPAARYIVQGGSLAANSSAQTGTGTLPFGSQIPVVLEGAESGANLVMTVGENVESSFLVAEDVVNESQQVVIPKGSKITGRFQPFQVDKTTGTQFTASKLTVGNTPYTINATSVPIPARKKSSIDPSDLVGSVSTLAAGALVDQAITGEISPGALVPGAIQTGQELGKTVLGGGSKTSDKVILVEPDNLGLTLNAEFAFLPGATTAFVDPSVNRYQVDTGTQVLLSSQSDNARYIMLPGETVPVELKTARPIYNDQNEVLVPEGSLVRGDVTPVVINGEQGAQFVAKDIVIGTQTYKVSAASGGLNPVSVKALNAADFQGNVIATSEASGVLRGVGSSSSSSSSSGGGSLLGIGNLLSSGGSKSGKDVIVFNPAISQLTFAAPLDLEELNNPQVTTPQFGAPTGGASQVAPQTAPPLGTPQTAPPFGAPPLNLPQ